LSSSEQGTPFGLGEAGDGQPAILPEARIDAMGRRRLVRGPVSVRAVRVGLESVQAIRALKPRRARDKGVQVAIRAGLHSGLVSEGVSIKRTSGTWPPRPLSPGPAPSLRHFTSFEMAAQASMKVLLATKSDELTFARELSMLAAVKVYNRGAVCAG
jgi:hypothetical protein